MEGTSGIYEEREPLQTNSWIGSLRTRKIACKARERLSNRVETLALQVCSVKFQVAHITWPEQHVSTRNRKRLFPMARARQPRQFSPVLDAQTRDSKRGIRRVNAQTFNSLFG